MDSIPVPDPNNTNVAPKTFLQLVIFGGMLEIPCSSVPIIYQSAPKIFLQLVVFGGILEIPCSSISCIYQSA